MMDGLAEALRAMARLDLPWMLGGSLAGMCYSEPRVTLDADVIVAARPGHEGRFAGAFPEVDFYVPPLSVIAHELRRGHQGSFNLIHQHTGFKVDVYPAGRDELMAWGLANRQSLSLAGEVVPVAPMEYVISMKLRFFALSGQEKHLRDIRSILHLQPACDRQRIQEWAIRYGVESAWQLASRM